jgi:7-cyano-7-deazaguanine synthase
LKKVQIKALLVVKVQEEKKAVILLSGGMDSATCLVWAKAQGYALYAMSFDYGQQHAVELAYARGLAKTWGVEQHEVLALPFVQKEASSLTGQSKVVEDHAGHEGALADTSYIPNTYVPCRNMIFLSLAFGWAEALGADCVVVGCSAIDYSNYPDCRPEFLKAFERMAALGSSQGVLGNPISVEAPLLSLSKAETIQLGLQHGLDYAATVTCYRADDQGRACGRCDACVLRKKGFVEAGVEDVTVYV